MEQELPNHPEHLSSPPVSSGLSKHIGNMCMRLRNGGKDEASPSLFPRFVPNTHVYLYASTVHMYCIYPAMTAFTDQYSLPNIFFDIGQL